MSQISVGPPTLEALNNSMLTTTNRTKGCSQTKTTNSITKVQQALHDLGSMKSTTMVKTQSA